MTICRFSVVIPVYNGACTIARALESVWRQTFPAQEIIVVDDGSGDGTPDVVRRVMADRSVSLTLISQANRGVSAARNVGAGLAKGEYVVFLDADDEMLPHTLETFNRLIMRMPEAVVAFGDAVRMKDGRVEVSSYLRPRLTDEGVHYVSSDGALRLLKPIEPLIFGNFVPIPYAIRREAFLAIGGSDEVLRSAQDRDMFARLALAYPNLWVFTWEQVSVIHYTENSLSSRNRSKRHAEDELAVLQKMMDRSGHRLLFDLRNSIRCAARTSARRMFYWASVEGPWQTLCAVRMLPPVARTPAVGAIFLSAFARSIARRLVGGLKSLRRGGRSRAARAGALQGHMNPDALRRREPGLDAVHPGGDRRTELAP